MFSIYIEFEPITIFYRLLALYDLKEIKINISNGIWIMTDNNRGRAPICCQLSLLYKVSEVLRFVDFPPWPFFLLWFCFLLCVLLFSALIHNKYPTCSANLDNKIPLSSIYE